MLHSTIQAPSHSRISKLFHCERAYFYDYVLGIRSKEEFPPMFMGSMLHIGLDHWHRTGEVEAAVEAMTQAWGSRKFFGDWAWVTAGHAECILCNYTKSKHAAGWDIIKLKPSDLRQDRLLATDAAIAEDGSLMLAEAGFVVDVPELGPVLVKPDLIQRVANGLRVTDHKTTISYLGAKKYNEAKFGHQLRLYALAMAALLDEPILEGVSNCIYSGEKAGSEKFGGKRFEPYVFDYSESDFEETRAWYRSGVERMKRMHECFTPEDAMHAPQNTGAHCGYCDYNSLCISAPALRPALIRMNFKQKES